jgi:hypothetical protein
MRSPCSNREIEVMCDRLDDADTARKGKCWLGGSPGSSRNTGAWKSTDFIQQLVAGYRRRLARHAIDADGKISLDVETLSCWTNR